MRGARLFPLTVWAWATFASAKSGSDLFLVANDGSGQQQHASLVPQQPQHASAPLPTIIPTIHDSSAPDPQQECPGYTASNVAIHDHHFTADLTLAGDACNVFGQDIQHLTLQVSLQTKSRLNVKISPTYIGQQNVTWFELDDQFVKQPRWDGRTTVASSDLRFDWSNEPSFQFSISRASSDEVLFSTFGHKIVFENQFLELVTNMVDDYNIYGLPEIIRNFRFGTNFNATLFNCDNADRTDTNSYGTHPFYQETRYREGQNSTAHGMYARNVHGQEWLMRDSTLTYRTIGGIIDLYFFSGQSDDDVDARSTALEVIRQYQQSVGFPTMQPYWGHGFHQCHWGWSHLQDLRDVVQNYRDANIPLEAIWTDIDVYYRYQSFTNDEKRFPSAAMQEFVAGLREDGQHYVPLVDSNVYYPDPNNASDVYLSYTRGDKLGVYIREAGTGAYFVGKAWPGNSVWADWLISSSQDWFTEELRIMNEATPFDGLWIDLNEPSNFNNVLAKRDLARSIDSDSRHLDFPPYKINNDRPTKQIIDGTISLSAFHNDEHQTREYDVHSLWSLGMARAAYNAISTTVHPGKRPFIISRSTGLGFGQYAGHWGGDNNSKWGAMYLSISQALAFQMVGVPMFGTDTCGFQGPNPGEELCARWFELNAFFPFYRNHYGLQRPAQEAYAWPSVAEASRRVMAIRYSLLTYLYTLFYNAHTRGDTVLRALSWEFPNDKSLRETNNQFMMGSALLITPVLTENATSVKGVLPGIGQGTRWYDWYTLEEVNNKGSGPNITMDAPLEHINLHIRGGSILALQQPGYTTRETRQGAYNLTIALDSSLEAQGSLFLDDGESIEQEATRLVQFRFAESKLVVTTEGDYHAAPPLAAINILGLSHEPGKVTLDIEGERHALSYITTTNGTLHIINLSSYFDAGAWTHDYILHLS